MGLLATSLCGSGWAADWLCQEEASQRHGNEIYACGIGAGKDENDARLDAFDNAKKEFERICQISDDCKGRMISVRPQRTACEQKPKNYSCHRLVVFEIQERGAASIGSRNVTSAPALDEAKEDFKPFKYQEIAHLPKLKRGMTKAQVLKIFGKPKNASPLLYGGHSFMFKGRMCMDGSEHALCSVDFSPAGRVSDYSHVNMDYTEDLK